MPEFLFKCTAIRITPGEFHEYMVVYEKTPLEKVDSPDRARYTEQIDVRVRIARRFLQAWERRGMPNAHLDRAAYWYARELGLMRGKSVVELDHEDDNFCTPLDTTIITIKPFVLDVGTDRIGF